MVVRRLRPAVALAVVVGVIGVAVALDPALATGLAFAIALILVPGAIVSRAVFNGSVPGFAALALLTLSFGIATLVLGGLILNLLPGGLTIETWTVYLVVVTITGLALIGIQRRARDVPISQQRLMAHMVATVPHGRIRSKDVVLIGIALGIGTLALGIARVAAVTEPTPQFTALWVVPDEYPPSELEVGVRSAEHEKTAYVVELLSGPTVLDRWDVTLEPGETWRTWVNVGVTPPTFTKPLEARLIVPGTSVPYRSVTVRDQSAR